MHNHPFPEVRRSHQNEYRSLGLTTFDNFIPREAALAMAATIKSEAAKRGKAVNGLAPYEDNPGAPYPANVMDERGLYKYSYLTSTQMLALFPHLFLRYTLAVPFLRKVTGEAVVVSPYAESQILGVSYSEPGDCQGAHRDTQPVTALLYLTDRGGNTGGCTQVTDFTGARRYLYPQAGTLLVMQGRHVRHYSVPVTDTPKIVCPMNYYTEQDTWRPSSLDADNYWEKA